MDVAVIGIDGLDPRLVLEWRDELPALSRLISEGGFGKLQSSYPPLTCPAWPTLVTGKQGGKHGVFGFTKPASDDPTRRTPVNYEDVAAESLWEVLDGAGLVTGVVNVPFTYPPSDLEHGFVVSGWPIPNKVNPASPPSVLEDLERSLGTPYEVNPFPMGPEYDRLDPESTRERILDGMWHHQEAFRTLLGQHDLDVFVAVYMAMDHAGHYLAWERDHLRAAYREQDEALADLLSALPEETNVVVVSDHGHGGRSEYSFWPNNWLEQEGYQRRTDSTGRRRRDLLRAVGATRENAIKAKNLLGLGDPREYLPQSVFDAIKRVFPTATEAHSEFDPGGIDWSATTAFAPVENIVYLNDDRFAGVVDGEERSETRDEVAAALASVDHPDDDRDDGLMSEVLTSDDLFEGPYAEQGPDVVFIADGMAVNSPIALGDAVFTPERFGEHRPKATLVTAGPAFEDLSEDCPEVDITDVFPLVCGLVDVPAPENIDGTVPAERFVGDIDIVFRASHDGRGAGEYTREEADRIEEQLKGLGYLQ